ncbi:MAG TPA: CvpA family protein, partial [Chloroflexota bacterium]|nr:CvpA family protein [Chloroflexota bacterium]
SILDVAILLVLAWFAIAGIRRGFILSVFDVVALVVTIVIATQTFHLAGGLIATQFGISPLLSDLLGFGAVMIVGEILRLIMAEIVSAALKPLFFALPPLSYVNSLAGLLPGALRGLCYASVALIALESIPFNSGLQAEINRAPVASAVLTFVSTANPSFQDALSVVVEGKTSSGADPTASLTSPVPIPAGIDSTPDPSAEAQILDMTNLARTQAGLSPLTVDPNLSAVARIHSVEMFHLAYFSHDSPIYGSPSERLQRAGITFQASGENIAYAPTIAMAFRGLMQSTEHRDNILGTGFHRIGVGVAQAGIWGYMITEDFCN